MDFSHSQDRQMLSDTLGRYLAQRYPITTRHAISASTAGWSMEHWQALADVGVIGAFLDPAVGGYGGTGFDIAAIFEQIGKALVVEPFLGTMMAARLIAATGGQDALLADMIAGKTIVAFAQEEPQSRYDLNAVETRADHSQDQWRLSGRKAVVPQLGAAQSICVSARVSGAAGDAAGIGIFLVGSAAPGLSMRDYPMIDGGRGGELILDGTPAALLSTQAHPLIEAVVAAGIVALCWEAVGVMDIIRATTLDYLRTRKQFGVPIGKFQALQHRMATVAIEIEQARSAAINAAAALDAPRNERERAVSAAKMTIGRVGGLVAEEAIQLHGGIGMTWELPLSHYAKRLIMIDHQLGDEDHHLERYIALGLMPA